jgi:peroxiredoxin
MAFYKTKDIGQATLSCRFKSSIAETSSSYELNILWCRSLGILANWGKENEPVLFIQGKKYYSINKEKKSITDLSPWRDERFFSNKNYPFYDSSFIYDLIRMNWHVTRNDGGYHLQNKGTTITIDSSDYSIRSYQNLDISEYGIQVTEWKLVEQRYPGKISETSIPVLLHDLKTFSNTKANTLIRNPKWTGKNVKDLLPDNLFPAGNFILLDFFYQSCMPCITSISQLKELQNEFSEERLTITGIDPVPDDSITMGAFRKRYGISYEVISGKKGIILNDIFNPEHVYPFYLLIDAKGTIRQVQEGKSERFFEKVRKEVSSQ